MSVQQAGTRQEQEINKKRWDNLTILINKEFQGFEGWMAKESHPKIIELTKTLTGDLSDNALRWECETQLEVITTLKETGQKKLEYLKNLLEQLQSQVLGAPLAETESEEDTSEHRLYALQKLDKTFEEVKEAFARWKVAGKRLKEVFRKETSDKTLVKDENSE